MSIDWNRHIETAAEQSTLGERILETPHGPGEENEMNVSGRVNSHQNNISVCDLFQLQSKRHLLERHSLDNIFRKIITLNKGNIISSSWVGQLTFDP